MLKQVEMISKSQGMPDAFWQGTKPTIRNRYADVYKRQGTRTDPHVAPREMKTLYLEPFRKGIQEAGALGVMSSYNDYDGERCV